MFHKYLKYKKKYIEILRGGGEGDEAIQLIRELYDFLDMNTDRLVIREDHSIGMQDQYILDEIKPKLDELMLKIYSNRIAMTILKTIKYDHFGNLHKNIIDYYQNFNCPSKYKCAQELNGYLINYTKVLKEFIEENLS